jgi:hypothetical protein
MVDDVASPVRPDDHRDHAPPEEAGAPDSTLSCHFLRLAERKSTLI